jgi:hypothetical protein
MMLTNISNTVLYKRKRPVRPPTKTAKNLSAQQIYSSVPEQLVGEKPAGFLFLVL